MNNRNADERSQEKAGFDGDSVEESKDDASTETPSKETKEITADIGQDICNGSDDVQKS